MASFERRLMCRECGFQAMEIALHHPRDLRQAEPEPAQGDDLGGAGHLVRTVDAPSRPAARGRDEAALLIKPQRLDRDAEAPRGLGGIQESCGGTHDSPRSGPPRLYGGGPKGRVKNISRLARLSTHRFCAMIFARR